MKCLALVAALVFSATQAALADTANGSGALALGGIVAQHSPLVGLAKKALLAAYLNGNAAAPHPAGEIITIAADSVRCRSSNVDITTHSCELKFGNGATVNISGRTAHELYATLVEVGVEPDGAAGSIYEAVTNLKCKVKADEVADRAGGGASCSYDPGP